MINNTIILFDKRVEIPIKYKKILEQKKCANVILVTDKDKLIQSIYDYEPELILISQSVEEDLKSLCELIRAQNSPTRPILVVLSKSSFLDDKLNSLDAGADDFLSEPIDLNEFVARLNAHLRRNFEENISQLTKLPLKNLTHKIMRKTLKDFSSRAILYIEINNFDAYREIYGEIPSAKLLQAYSAILKATIDEDDFVGHIDNEKFLIITSSFKAEKMADYLNFAFDTIVKNFYSIEDSSRGYILLSGNNKAGFRLPIMTSNIGVINSDLKNYTGVIEAFNALQKSVQLSKTLSGSSKVIDRPLIASEKEVEYFDNKIVLIFEKDEDLAYLLKTTLEIHGYQPIRFDLIKNGLNNVKKYSPALVIIDSGSEFDKKTLTLCKSIKKLEQRDIKVIFTDSTHEKEMILDAGADLYLPKPYELKDLFMWINKLID